MRTHLLALLLLAAAALFIAPSAQAQERDYPAGYQVLARPGQPTLVVMLMGANAGMYAVGEGISLDEFLALTGVTTGEETDRIRRSVHVRVLREAAGQRAVIYEAEMKRLLREPRTYPELLDGDVVVVEVEQRRKFDLRETLSIVSSLSSLTLLVLRLVDVL